MNTLNSQLKIISVIITATVISVFAIMKLSVFTDLLSKRNLDTAIGILITVSYLISIVYLLSHSQRERSGNILLWIIFFIGCIGGTACYASVYSLHELKCAVGVDGSQDLSASYIDYLHYSAFTWAVGEPAGFCSPQAKNKLVPTIQVIINLAYLALSFIFLYKSKREK